MMEIRRMPIDQAKIIQILNEEDQYFVSCHHRPPRAGRARMLLTMPMRGSTGFSLCHTLKWIGFITK